jgi:hypothetical protein
MCLTLQLILKLIRYVQPQTWENPFEQFCRSGFQGRLSNLGSFYCMMLYDIDVDLETRVEAGGNACGCSSLPKEPTKASAFLSTGV